MPETYEDMTGPELAEELTRRELPVTGRVNELRARLRENDEKRAQVNADEPEPIPEVEEAETDDVEVPEPREPLRILPLSVTLTEDQARVLNNGEARIRAFTKHVNKITDMKYAAGDQVTALNSPESTMARVLPYGVEIELTSGDPETEEG